MNIQLTEQEWLQAWQLAGGRPAVMARQTGMNLRNIYARRRTLERTLGSPLPTTGGRLPAARLPKVRINERLADGVLIVFSDCHFWPGEPTAAHQALCRVAKALKPAIVVANGDVLDGATTSRHHRLGWEQRPKLIDELRAAQDRMAEVERAGKGARLILTLGNHDNRLDGWLANNAPEVEDLPGTCLADYFSRWSLAMSLHLNEGTPGHTVVKHRYKGGKYADANNALNAGCHMVTGHDHMLNVFNWGDYTGRKWGIRTGQLSEPYGPQFSYAEDNPRAHCSGFAVLTYRDFKLMPPELCYVIDGQAYFRGDKV